MDTHELIAYRPTGHDPLAMVTIYRSTRALYQSDDAWYEAYCTGTLAQPPSCQFGMADDSIFTSQYLTSLTQIEVGDNSDMDLRWDAEDADEA